MKMNKHTVELSWEFETSHIHNGEKISENVKSEVEKWK